MKCKVCQKLLLFVGTCLFFLAEAKGIPVSTTADSISLSKHAEYAVHPLGASLKTIVAANEWQHDIPLNTDKTQVVWLRVKVEHARALPQPLVCTVEQDLNTTLYVNNRPSAASRYFVRSIWTQQGVYRYYTFEVTQTGYIYLQIYPTQTSFFNVGKNTINGVANCYLLQATSFNTEVKTQNRTNEAGRRFTFLIIGGLGVISLISLLIALFWRRRLFVYYFIYGFSPFLLLVVKEICFSALLHSTTFLPHINTFSRASEFLQLVSLSAYVMFVAELLDFKKAHIRFYKVFVLLAVLMLFQGIVEVGWLFLTYNIAGYEKLVAWSSSLLFPIFIGVIIWMSVFIRHHLIKYVIVSNAIFVGMLLLGFLRFSVFDTTGIPVYVDSFFKLPFATLLEMVVFSFAIAAKISYDNALRVESEKRLRETEMMALRSQMNPHFIFNSLNTVRNFILQNDTANANKYLSKFSKLLRQILNFSRANVITLGEELETVRLYLELESARFESGFRYEINVPNDLETDAIPIPPLLLQPYVENAIWHGLRHSVQAEKSLKINLSEQDGVLLISILDNGVGRAEAAKLKSKTKDSLGTKITQERIELFNVNENSTLRVETNDVETGGTEVVLTYQLY